MDKRITISEAEKAMENQKEVLFNKKIKYLSEVENPYITTAGEFTVKTSYSCGKVLSELLAEYLMSA